MRTYYIVTTFNEDVLFAETYPSKDFIPATNAFKNEIDKRVGDVSIYLLDDAVLKMERLDNKIFLGSIITDYKS